MAVYSWIAILVVIFVCSSGLEENAIQITVSSPMSELGTQICTHKDHAIARIVTYSARETIEYFWEWFHYPLLFVKSNAQFSQ